MIALEERLRLLEKRVRLLGFLLDAKIRTENAVKPITKEVNHWHLNQLEAIADDQRRTEEQE